MKRPVPRPLLLVLITLALLPFILSACARQGSYDALMEADSSSAAFKAPAPGSSGGEIVPTSDRKLVRTVDLSLRVLDPERAKQQVEALTLRLGGYVEALNLDRSGEIPWIRLTIRVPGEHLDEALTELRGLAVRVEHESQRVEDVTTRYVDVEARLKTLTATEEELRALLAESRQAGREVKDILEVYRELTQVQSDREALQAQLTALERQVDYSTISLALWPDASVLPVASDDWRPGDTAKGSLRTLVALLRGLGNFAIFAVIVLVPVGLLIGWPLWLMVRWLWRKRRVRAAAVETTEERRKDE